MVFTAIRDFLCPPTCGLCGVPLPEGPAVLLCPTCTAELTRPVPRPCERCGMPTPEFGSCSACRKKRPRFAATVSLGTYEEKLRNAVILSKNEAWEPLARAMAALLSEKLATFVESWNVDVIVPIPSHWRRRWGRGTNSAEIVAETIAHRLELPLVRHGLKCQRLAQKQGTLTPARRRKNVEKLFHVTRPGQLVDRTVLLVDDVMTTGATMSDASRALTSIGARNIYATVLARGTGRR